MPSTPSTPPRPLERTPPRAALADAIARRDDVKRKIAESAASRVTATAAHNDAWDACSHATAMLVRALPRDEALALAREKGWRASQHEFSAALPRISVPEAKQGLADADDAFASATRALEDATEDERAFSGQLHGREMDVKAAAMKAAVADPAYLALRAEAIRCHRIVLDAGMAMGEVDSSSGKIQDDELMAVAKSLPLDKRWPLQLAWQDAFLRLCQDADAILPAAA